MPKQNEIDLPAALGPDGRRHALDKPFSDPGCGRYLSVIGAIIQLLPPRPARLLDLGVGSGWTSIFFARHGYQVVAQDIAEGMIALARENQRRAGIENVAWVVQDYESMSFEAEFDCAVFHDSLHHAEDETAALAKVHRALKPGGVCITAEPGTGHALAVESKKFSGTFGVTEKDMPPARILRAARAVGFRHFEIFERPVEPVRLFAGTDENVRRPGRLRFAVGFIGKGLRCLFWGPRRSEYLVLGFPPPSTFIHHHLVRLHK